MTQSYILRLSLTNCVSNYDLGYIIDGQTYTITLTANTGYYFPIYSATYIDNNGITNYMNVSQDGLSVSCTFIANNIYQFNGQYIQADAISIQSDKYCFIGIYKPTNNQLIQLTQQRFIQIKSGLQDLTEYIISLKKYYYDLPTNGKENVYYGTHNTNILCDSVNSDIIEVDCGSVEITELYNNSLDYNNTTIMIYLPFIGDMSLDTKRIMNKTVNLKYMLNPVNGDCVALLFDDIGEIKLATGNLSFQIPIRYTNTSVYINNYIENPLYMASQTPFIEIKTYEIYNSNPLHGYDNNLWIKISDCNGYVLFNDIDLLFINNITSDIIDEITRLLLSGICVG